MRAEKEQEKFFILFNFDVSETMEKSFDDSTETTNCSDTIFSTLNTIVENTDKHKMIKIGGTLFGCKHHPHECDFMKLISSIEINHESNQIPVEQEIIDYCESNKESYRECLGKLGEIYGAKYLIKYLQKVSEQKCEEIYKIAIGDQNLCQLLVDNLPEKVKNGVQTAAINGGKKAVDSLPYILIAAAIASSFVVPGSGVFFIPYISAFFTGANAVDQYYDASVQEEVDHALQLCLDNVSERISCENYNWNESIHLKIVNGEVLKNELNEFKRKVDQIGKYVLLNYFRQYIYGPAATSLAITNSLATFLNNPKTRYRILFLITDGEHNEGVDPYDYLVENLGNDELKDIIFVSCYYSSNNLKNPRKLYYKCPPKIDKYCTKLFNMSSVLPVSSSGFQILAKKYNWEMPKERVCHLFFQVNHPDIIKEFSEVLTDLVNDENFFTNAFSSIYMNAIRDDQLMNQKSFEQNNEPICFAYACACTIQLSLCRIFCREIKSFNSIFDQIINDFSPKRDRGAVVSEVLRKHCKKYKLHYKELKNEEEARLAISLGRVCVAIFWLPKKAWDKFSLFYQTNPKGILKKSDLIQPNGSLGNKKEKGSGGHAVVLIDANISALEFLNSWGPNWGNNGRFRVENADVLKMIFYDVYWTLNDLTNDEKDGYQRSIDATSEAIQNNDPDPSKYSSLYFRCTHCKKLVRDQNLSTSSTSCICPFCKSSFNPRDSSLRRGILESI